MPRPGWSNEDHEALRCLEREVQGIHEFGQKYQTEDLGYPSIVGAGHNGCILHYIDNYKPKISNKELILMDLGAEYRGYTPISRAPFLLTALFAKQKKDLWTGVGGQEEGMKACKPGAKFDQLYQATKKVIDAGLAELGIIKPGQQHSYYPHGCCHHIGLDVHDRGEYNVLEENMIITIEPGIYIPENSLADRNGGNFRSGLKMTTAYQNWLWASFGSCSPHRERHWRDDETAKPVGWFCITRTSRKNDKGCFRFYCWWLPVHQKRQLSKQRQQKNMTTAHGKVLSPCNHILKKH